MKLASLAATAAMGLAMTAWLGAQTPPLTPPNAAKDITNMQVPASAPAPTQAVAPTAVVAAPPSVLRVYIDTLQGSDAQALAGLIKQALFDSRQVVVTETESNASLILKGMVSREPLPEAHRTSTASRRHSGARTASPGSPANVVDLDQLGSSAGNATALDLASTGSGLPPLPGLDSSTDLTKYHYRLDLEVVNPEGDLVWMSGRGRQALPYQGADDAVARTLSSLLTALPQLKAAASSN